MGKDARSKELSTVGQTAQTQYQNLYKGPTDLETEFIPQSQNYWNRYQTAADQQTQDYGDIMGGYKSFASNLGGPTKFSYDPVSAQRPAELNESYGYLREAAPGYRTFAETGGYSPTDVQELRARGMEPIRSAYGNTMMELNRARSLGGAGGAPNYIAAASKAQREYPGQMADAMTTVNAELANSVRQGKLAGLAGLTGIGGTMGGLSSEEANRMLQAAMANQSADLQTQAYGEQSLQNQRQAQLAALSGQTSLYGTTPAMASMFGNQALNAYQQRANLEQMRNNYGLGLLGAQTSAFGNQTQQDPWWKTALNVAGSVAPYLLGGGGGSTADQSGVTREAGGPVITSAYGQESRPYEYPYFNQDYLSSVGGSQYSNPNKNLGFTGWADQNNPSTYQGNYNAGVPYNPYEYSMYDFRGTPNLPTGGLGGDYAGRYDPFFGWVNS
jgi:hypothetical protein